MPNGAPVWKPASVSEVRRPGTKRRRGFAALAFAIALSGCGGENPGAPAPVREWPEVSRGAIVSEWGGRRLTLRLLGRSQGELSGVAREAGRTRAEWELGGASIVAELFRSTPAELGVFHLRCDRPGDLEFRVDWEGPAEVVGRRLLRSGDGGAWAWVFPMESDVATVDGGIELRGEGEALVVAGVGSAAVEAMRELGVEEDRVGDVRELLERLGAAGE